MPRLTVIIVNYNSGDRLAKCLRALEDQTFRDFEIIIADNGSHHDSLTNFPQSDLPVRVEQFGENLGFAEANNRAAEIAKGEWLVFLNPDAYPRENWLAELVTASEKYPHADSFGSTQLDAANPETVDGAGDVMHILGVAYRGQFGRNIHSLPPPGECFAPCAAAAMYRRSAFTALGGFDASFFCYGEDVDLGFRLRLAGGRCVQWPAAIVLHEGSGVTGKASDFTIYHGNRNRIWLTHKNMPALLYWPLLPARLVFDLCGLVRWSLAGKGGVYWKAILDGYGGLPARSGLRRKTVKNRRATTLEIARALSWSPIALATRQAKTLPLGKADGEIGDSREI